MLRSLLTAKQYRAVLEAAARVHAAEDRAVFAREALTALCQLTSADVGSIVLLVRGELIDYYLTEAGVFSAEEIRYFQECPAENPIVRDVALHGGSHPRRNSDLMSVRQLRNTDFYNHCLRRNRLDFALAAPFTLSADTVAGVSLNRQRVDFTGEETAMLGLLGPHLDIAWRKLERIATLEADARAAQTGFGIGGDGWHEHLRLRALGLRRREAEVLRLLAHRLTNAEIAAQLAISPRTVETHLDHIYGKLQVRSRHAAAGIARRTIER